MTKTAEIDVTPVLTVHATYVSGDYVGTSGTPMAFADTNHAVGDTGTIVSAALIDYAVQSLPIELWLFDTLVTPPTDSAAWTVADADLKRCIGVIPFGLSPFSPYYISGANSISFFQGVGIAYKATDKSISLWGCLVTRGAPTYADGDLTVRLSLWQD